MGERDVGVYRRACKAKREHSNHCVCIHRYTHFNCTLYLSYANKHFIHKHLGLVDRHGMHLDLSPGQ